MTRTCPTCGHENTDSMKFCSACGYNLTLFYENTGSRFAPAANSPAQGGSSGGNLFGGRKISGIASHVNTLSSVQGSISSYSGQTSGYISTGYVTRFRINNSPCIWEGSLNISDGDQVTAAGTGSGELVVYAIDNMSTGMRYTTPGPSTWRQVGLFIMGLFFLAFPAIGFYNTYVVYALQGIQVIDPPNNTGSFGWVIGGIFILFWLFCWGAAVLQLYERFYYRSFTWMLDN